MSADYYRVARKDGWTIYIYQSDSRTVTLLPPRSWSMAGLDSEGVWSTSIIPPIPPAVREVAQRMWDEQAAALGGAA